MTGWPWPLNGIQGWFEGLWNWVSEAVNTAAAWILDNFFKPLTRWFIGLYEGIYAICSEAFDIVRPYVSGLPWPLRGVAQFFLFPIGILYVITKPLFSWLWENVFSKFVEVGRWLGDWFSQASAWISSGVNWLWENVNAGISGLWTQLTVWFGQVGDAVSGGLSWLWNNVSSGLNTLAGTVANGVNAVSNTLATMFNGAVATIRGWVSDAMAAVANALGGALQSLWNWLTTVVPSFLAGAASFINEHVIQPILGGLNWVFERLRDAVQGLISNITALFRGHSPIRPEEALPIGLGAIALAITGGGLATTIVDLISTKVVGTGLDLRSLGRYIVSVINPQMFLGAVLGVLIGVGVRTPLSQFYRSQFRPEVPSIADATRMFWRGKITEEQYHDVLARHGYGEPFESGYMELTRMIPPAPDLIQMVVREAFMPEMVVEAPAIFAEYMTKVGYSKEWADRYWTAHFVPIALTQAYENLWRGFWTKEDFMHALHIADIHPMWREDIYNVAFRPPGIRELGYGYDTGVYTPEDIAKYRRWGGLNPEDAEKAARAMIAYRTEAEREALRREALADYVEGLDSEETLRSKLEAIGGRPEIIDLWVARAKYRAERDIKLDLIKVVKDQAVKGLISEDELREELVSLGVVPERVESYALEVQVRRTRAVPAVTAEKRKLLAEAKIAKAWELGLIGDEEYVSRLVERDYTPEDAKLMLDILRTPRPVTPEEIERRKASITARINRTRRRYDLILRRLDSQIALISDEIETAELTHKEILDVYDTELSYLGEELAVTPPEKAPAIEKRMALLRERRDVAVARHAEQMTKLKGELAAAADRKQELIRLRDEEIAELESELKTLGVAG